MIHSKLVPPPLPEHVVARPRLDLRLGQLIESRALVIVSAAAGSGKTTAVAAATRPLERPVAWLRVDGTDAAPGRLVTYLDAALTGGSPDAAGVVRAALRSGIDHAEAAGLLAEAVTPSRPVLVLDDLERLGGRRDAWRVIDGLLRHLGPGCCVVLISRRDVPTEHVRLPAPDRIGFLNERDLAFTAKEAAEVLDRPGPDAQRVVDATAGWVTGVLFEAWTEGEPSSGLDGKTDPLYEYISSQVLGGLDESERRFLVATSLLDEVSAPRAAALGIERAAAHLRSLRAAHLPVSWDGGGSVMRCHSYFREYLLERFALLDGEDAEAMRRAHGRLLASEGHDEEAAEELLAIGDPREALAPASRAIVPVVERLDFGIAERWLDALAGVAPDGASPLATAELMLSLARDEVGRAVRVADRLIETERDAGAPEPSQQARLLMAWCYLHVGRFEEVGALLEGVESELAVKALRYGMGLLEDLPGDHARPVRPEVPGGPIDAIVCVGDWGRGRLKGLTEARSSRWVERIEAPWRIAAMRALGRTQEALQLYERAVAEGTWGATMLVFAGPDVMMDAGRADEAARIIAEGRKVADATGSLAYQGFSRVTEAKFALRTTCDPERARDLLAEPECRRAAGGMRLIAELAGVWHGLALLHEERDAEALPRLRQAVGSMRAGDRILELPTAAVYLAEAETRAGDQAAADRAAELAAEAARRQGSNHLLLQALADFPEVCAARIDASDADSTWHELGRALLTQGAAIKADIRARVELEEFGRRALMADGSPVAPRIAKSYELLAYLAAAPDGATEREKLLDALFDGRRDRSTRAYLRQAVHRLREVLPEGAIDADEDRVLIGSGVSVVSESVRLESRLAEAARFQGHDRLDATLDALGIWDRGEYLPGPRGGWADERERWLAELAAEARHQAAVLCFGAGRYEEAGELTRETLCGDPYRESAWRLAMRIAHALGDEGGVLRAYRGCEEALSALDVGPARSTRRLLERLRV